MKQFYLFFLTSALIACEKKKESRMDNLVDTLSRQVIRDTLSTKHLFEETLGVSDYFLKSFEKMNDLETKLIRGAIIYRNIDTISFPIQLKDSKTYQLAGDSKKVKVNLLVSQLNFSTIKCTLEIADEAFKKNWIGEADLMPTFYLGSESDEDSKEGIGYTSIEYWSREVDCRFSIRLGHFNGELKARVQGCFENKKYFLELEKCPTLHQKKS